ncbi:MAG: HNH endonuclease [Saccharothrix sp.]|nr:HNH endonuclease [Saccharothrix sp.]
MRTLVPLVLTLLLALTGCLSVPVADGEPDSAPPTLAALTLAPEASTAGYSRDRFPHWSDQGGGCDTREIVIRDQGAAVVTDGSCRATAGRWVSAYDGVTVTDATKLDVDHVVPLAEAWRSGASAWTDRQRAAFANDTVNPQLVAVTARSNRAKGDRDPAKWMPVADYRCAYAANWLAVKAAYRLTVDRAERDTLAAVLADCGGR